MDNKFKPTQLNEFYGQTHLVSKTGIITKMLEKDFIKSMILYGPSGCGKTTLANIIANSMQIKCGFINAAINNKQDLVDKITEAKLYERYLLIIDEIHRLNKDKQDILLPYLETNNFFIIGLTTLNPYHSVNPAIRSRVQIFELHSLTTDDIINRLKQIIEQAFSDYQVDPQVVESIANNASGDLRSAIEVLELLIIVSDNKVIEVSDYLQLNNKKSLLLDKNSDYYYDLLSALQKSIRGSDVDAALHYLARLITLEDLESITRRLSIIAYEDIGLANPNLASRIPIMLDVASKVGFPEAKIPLANAVVELALSPKSNTAYQAIKNALTDLNTFPNVNVPKNINAHPIDYLYPHDYPNNWVKQTYLPKEMENISYMSFNDNEYEKRLNTIYKKLKQLKTK